MPQLRLRDSLDIAPDQYRVLLGGIPIGGAQLRSGRLLAIDVGEANPAHRLAGEATTDPTFKCPALWIEKAARDDATAEGFLVVDASTIIATHLGDLLTRRAEQLLSPEEVRAAMDALAATMPGLVEAVTPDPLSLGALIGGRINRRTPMTTTTKTKTPSKLDALEKLLTRKNGASIAEMMTAAGWQQHSVRGAMAGALKKRGLAITSTKVDGVRRYHAETSA